MGTISRTIKSNAWWAALVAVVFVGANAYLIKNDIFELSALPLVFIGGWLVVYYPKAMLVVLSFLTPFSFNFEDISAFGGIGFYFPTEPLLFVLMVLYLLKVLVMGHRESTALMRHPLSVAILVNVIWIGITALFSLDIVVSLKFLLSRLWFVLVLYFMANSFFESRRFLSRFLKAYVYGLAVVIVYTVARHSTYGFDEDAGHWVMWPFYKDHTSYGAMIAMFFPLVLFQFWHLPWKRLSKWGWLVLLGVFTVGLVLSYTRAAWVSLVGAAMVYGFIKLRIDYKLLLAGAALLVGGFFAFQTQIIHELEKNRQDSSDNISEHITSITNISSDASNLERLNRWHSAWKMFLKKPVTGHGPGTYSFEYAKYQKSSDRTIISTNAGDAGNAHSEYLGPLSESGLLGMLTIVAVMIASLYTGIKLYYRLYHDPYLKGVVMCIVLGLVTYFLHGVLNNFLDTDKASVPIWGMMSILVALTLKENRKGRRSVDGGGA